jgi:hypothetical protein
MFTKLIHHARERVPRFTDPRGAEADSVVVQLLVAAWCEEQKDAPAPQGIVNGVLKEPCARDELQPFQWAGANQLIPRGRIGRSPAPLLKIALSGNAGFLLDSELLALP